MTAIEKMRILQRDIESLSPSSCEPEEILFLVKSFNVMREIAAENYYDNWKYGDESKERKEAFLIVDQALEERMKEEK